MNTITTFSEYQQQAIKTDIYENPADRALGLIGEAGEYAEALSKVGRDQGGILTSAHKEHLGMELGDIVWFTLSIAHHHNVPLIKITDSNDMELFHQFVARFSMNEDLHKLTALLTNYATHAAVDAIGGNEYTLLPNLSLTLRYIAKNAACLGYGLVWIAQSNLEKLAGRNERGTLTGSGEDR